MDQVSALVLLVWTIGAICIVGCVLGFYIAGIEFEIQSSILLDEYDAYKSKHPIKSMVAECVHNSLPFLTTLPQFKAVPKGSKLTVVKPGCYPTIKQ